ncbi:progesterone binding protein [Plectosphaerella plurivora]|uniref:Progesterone binding protein n=1 Tax=Plectosphaerella plurivora TaxID=936078 RepID=A0A9P9AG01_9PEZI|nr:progesterone binding protein [Plectosphaerella plurivora]
MSGKFAPKEPVVLNPPKDDPISPEELAAANGTLGGWRLIVPRLGFMATAHGPRLESQTFFAGKDASRALAKTSTKAEDVKPEWQDLDDKEKGVLDDWNTFFSKRYNVVGFVAGATNRE